MAPNFSLTIWICVCRLRALTLETERAFHDKCVSLHSRGTHGTLVDEGQKSDEILKKKKKERETSREGRGGEKMLKYFPANVIYLCQWGSIAQSFCKVLRWEGGQRGLYVPASHNIHNPDVSVAGAARSTVPCGKACIFSNFCTHNGLDGPLDTFKVSWRCDFSHHILFHMLFF